MTSKRPAPAAPPSTTDPARGVVDGGVFLPAETALAGYAALVSFPVQWGEMDAYQHVNNVVYFRWFESARTEYFKSIDFTSNTGVGPILSSTSCRYRAPLYYPDRVTAGCRVRDVLEDRFTMEIALFSDAAGRVAATGEAVIVAYDYAAQKKASLPAAVRARLLTGM